MDAKKIKLIGAGIVVILLAIVIFQNFEETQFHILFAKIEMPKALMIFGAFAIGTLSGWIAPMFLSGKKKQ